MGGLALGHALAKANHPILLFERDAATHSRAQGYRLHLDDAGVAALKECLTPESFELFLRLSEPLGQGFGFFDHRLRQLAYFRAPAKSARAIVRSTFRELLLHTLQARVEFGCAARGFRVDGDGVEVDFEDGSTRRGGLLIGADGSASAIARQLVPAQPLSDTGVVVIIGKVPTTGRVLQCMPRGRFERLGIVLGPDNVNLFLSQHLPRHGETGALNDVPQVRAWLAEAPGYSVWALLLGAERFASEENPVTKARVMSARCSSTRVNRLKTRWGARNESPAPSRSSSASGHFSQVLSGTKTSTGARAPSSPPGRLEAPSPRLSPSSHRPSLAANRRAASAGCSPIHRRPSV
jgi:2-polyprenyl-6-methoxyphenol hydroxylase-like FAD-dependent oxidoreductase